MTYPITRLILVRHAETEANVAGRMQGRTNDPLTERGRRQIESVARRLATYDRPIEAVYSSSLLRARLTADAIGAALNLDVRLRDNLQEMHLGDLDSVSAEELAAATPRSWDDRYPGGESAREFAERVVGGFYGIAAAHAGGAAVAVSHGGAIATALSFWEHGHGAEWQRYAPDNCSISIVEFRMPPDVVVLNDCAHLE